MGTIALVYLGLLLLGIALRALIARRARRFARSGESGQSQIAVIPTTWSPFHFLVCRQNAHDVETFRLNAISGRTSQHDRTSPLDNIVPPAIPETIEWRTMRDLSPFYHAVERSFQEGTETVLCRDMRIRNFHTRFGEFICRVDSGGCILSKQWEV